MFVSLLQREIRRGLSSFAFLLILTVMCILAALGGYRQVKVYNRTLAELTTRNELNRPETDPQVIVVAKPAPPLLPFFNGVYNVVPDEVSLRSQSVLVSPSNEDIRPLNWVSSDIDLGHIIGVLLTLMAVFLTYDIASMGVRDSREILSNPTIRYPVLAGRVLGAISLIGIVLLASVVIYFITVWRASGGSYTLSFSSLLSIAVCTFAGFIAICVFVLVSVTASNIASSPTVSLYASLSIWTIAVVVWPPVAGYLASRIYPLPAPQTFRHELLSAETALDLGELAEHRNAAGDLATNGAGIEDARRKYDDIHSRWMNRKEQELGPLVDRHQERLRRQQSLVKSLASLSPYGAFLEFAVGISETAPADQESFLESAQQYGRHVFLHDWMHSSDVGEAAAEHNTASPAIPAFQMPTHTIGERLLTAAPQIGLLLLQIGLLAGISIYRVRTR